MSCSSVTCRPRHISCPSAASELVFAISCRCSTTCSSASIEPLNRSLQRKRPRTLRSTKVVSIAWVGEVVQLRENDVHVAWSWAMQGKTQTHQRSCHHSVVSECNSGHTDLSARFWTRQPRSKSCKESGLWRSAHLLLLASRSSSDLGSGSPRYMR
jgi:hypothetical protein